jgi:uncharacterized protein YecE (DUF72 family)
LPHYTEGRLKEWADRVATAWPATAAVFAYFNNDQSGAAVLDAETFIRVVRGASHPETAAD